jgi:hypothetical protein
VVKCSKERQVLRSVLQFRGAGPRRGRVMLCPKACGTPAEFLLNCLALEQREEGYEKGYITIYFLSLSLLNHQPIWIG